MRLPSLFAMLALIALTAGPAAAADVPGTGDEKSCGDQNTTPEIEECFAARMKVWDKRLNAAYGALMKIVDPEQREPLRKAQRLWIQYRDANCGFYGAGQGTIHRVEYAECMQDSTRERALELERAGAQ